jgi:hypothetical protein
VPGVNQVERIENGRALAMTEKPDDSGKHGGPPGILGGAHARSRAMNRRPEFEDEMKNLL